MLASLYELHVADDSTKRAIRIDGLEDQILLADPINPYFHWFPAVANANRHELRLGEPFPLVATTATDIHSNTLPCLNLDGKRFAFIVDGRAMY
jgi:hypothetical protein